MFSPAVRAQEASFKKTNEIKSLQAARGIAVLLVVICHSAAFVGEEPALWHSTPVIVWLRGTALGVQLFFVISGIVIFRSHRKDLGQLRRVGAFYWKRFRRIYPLYWIFLTLTLTNRRAAIYPGRDYLHLPSVIVSNYLLVHLFSYQTIMVQGWTLFDEIEFYIVFSLCILNRKIGFAVLSVWLLASLLFLTPSSPYWTVVFSPYHLLFGFGILVALALDADVEIPQGLFFWLGAIVFFTAIVIAGPFHRGVYIRLFSGVGAAAMLLGAAMLERRGKLKVPRWLTLAGDASYSIYLVHFMAISVVARFSYAHLRILPIPVAGWMLILILCGMSAGMAVYYAVERPLLRVLGKRSTP